MKLRGAKVPGGVSDQQNDAAAAGLRSRAPKATSRFTGA